MKNICCLLLLLLFIACSKNDGINPMVKEELIKYNVNPSNPEQINQVFSFGDSIDYKYVTGIKNNNAWISKFTPNGDEIFSFELQNDKKNYQLSAYTYQSLYLDKDLLFLYAYCFDDSVVPDYVNNTWIHLTVIDFETGKEIYRFEPLKSTGDYSIHKSQKYYLVLSYISRRYIDPEEVFITMIDSDGCFLWSRKKNENEIIPYNQQYFLDKERIVYIASDSYKIINLKDYTLIQDFTKDKLPLIGDGVAAGYNISYNRDSVYVFNNNIRMTYTKNETFREIDAIGNITYVDKTIGRYYYDVDINNYQVMAHGKLE